VDWLEIELLLLPVIVVLLGALFSSARKFVRVETKVEMLEKHLETHLSEEDGIAVQLSKQFTELGAKLDGVGQRLSHIEGYIKRDREES